MNPPTPIIQSCLPKLGDATGHLKIPPRSGPNSRVTDQLLQVGARSIGQFTDDRPFSCRGTVLQNGNCPSGGAVEIFAKQEHQPYKNQNAILRNNAERTGRFDTQPDCSPDAVIAKGLVVIGQAFAEMLRQILHKALLLLLSEDFHLVFADYQHS